MICILLILFLCFDAYGYDARLYIEQDSGTEALLYNADRTTSYTVTFKETDISSETNVFYVPVVVKDSQLNVLTNVDFQIDSEQLNANLSENAGEFIYQVPITLAHIRRYYSSGTVVTIPMIMNVHVDAETLHIVRFNLIVHTIGSLTISPDRIGWRFSGSWSTCSDDISMSYSGVLYNMNVSITSDNNFCMVSPNSSDRISYSIYNSRLTGSKNAGYTMGINDNETLNVQVSADSENSVMVRAGDYSDSITIQLVPAV